MLRTRVRSATYITNTMYFWNTLVVIQMNESLHDTFTFHVINDVNHPEFYLTYETEEKYEYDSDHKIFLDEFLTTRVFRGFEEPV